MKGVVKKVTIAGKTIRIAKVGTSVKLKATVKASKGANKVLQWTSSNKKYAVVNGSGKVTLKKAGKGKGDKFEPIRNEGFFSLKYQKERVRRERFEYEEKTAFHFYIILTEDPSRIIGMIGLNNVVWGAFCSAFLGYKLDKKSNGTEKS